jgi:formylglycine-generating enzyme required for sulfatase activity
VQRGGSWYRGATDLRAGHRERHPAGRRGPGVGFRCVYEE